MPVTISGNGTVTGAQVGYNAVATITATDASWTVPTLADPVVKVTVVGGGGGGGGNGGNGSSGTSSSFGAYGTASGGNGGKSSSDGNGATVQDGFRSWNGGDFGEFNDNGAHPGLGGEVVIAYADLTGVSTVNVTVGAGGAGGAAGAGYAGSAGGDGVVIVEYRAG